MMDRAGGVEGQSVRPGKYSRVERERRFLLAMLLSKPRFSVPPLGVDVFDGHLQGLALAEAEFTTDEEAQSFVPPAECVAEVTDDARFAGGRLVQASRQELREWLAEYGLRPEGSQNRTRVRPGHPGAGAQAAKPGGNDDEHCGGHRWSLRDP
ncbi:hypothetical protein ABT039_40045 [Streptomyces lasiicapitis]|uniref:hypothetical protein n=1 Tax=Streptomyces lasiicapitis TaxID=1923961 RepID=UPI00332D6183